MGDRDIFEGLPPPSAPAPAPVPATAPLAAAKEASTVPPPPPLKSALKRRSSPESRPEGVASGKRLRFKTTTDASETQVIQAMEKITSHINNPTKFSKASKLAIQLIQAGSVKPATSDCFFAILEAAMSSPTACNAVSVRADYHALFSAAQGADVFFSKKQRNQLAAWTIRAVVANDLYTDDSFVFSKATGRMKEAISNLPIASKDEDMKETAIEKQEADVPDITSITTSSGNENEESDPFGLDSLIPSSRTSKKDERSKEKKINEEEEATMLFLKSQRAALMLCLEIAARRYKTPWCQTSIDILVKHAFDNRVRFTANQRDAIEKLWVSIHEQQTRRKQGKSVSGKLDVNGFELLQQKYANEKISIRHSVGGSGDRQAQQWLG
ncbi:uncharacterized protein LOC124938372 [Impatiens glandulifera]|uniref:uncharacterized protein LOC124938372 n=1 Tax=Impatiens glandulifera TaxID=253017 RepID=UPI001FB057C0|nr:uncharacterized protein LOC124938372 [Impatiens glandulifera]